MERAYRADAWSGSSLQEALRGVDAACAARRPREGSHTIWEIVLHAAAWKGVVRQRLAGAPVRLPEEGDWPSVVDTGEAAWAQALSLLEARHAALLEAVRGLTDDRLEDVLITEQSRETGGGVSVYVTLHGVLQHDLYHAAQVALLKRGCGGSPAPGAETPLP
jgi:uncharacterized damage-inducible protein DinB